MYIYIYIYINIYNYIYIYIYSCSLVLYMQWFCGMLGARRSNKNIAGSLVLQSFFASVRFSSMLTPSEQKRRFRPLGAFLDKCLWILVNWLPTPKTHFYQSRLNLLRTLSQSIPPPLWLHFGYLLSDLRIPSWLYFSFSRNRKTFILTTLTRFGHVFLSPNLSFSS